MLTTIQRRYLRSLAHTLHPIVRIGRQGLTDNVKQEILQSLAAHELIKIQIEGERDMRVTLYQTLCQELHIEPIQAIGKQHVVYRAKDKPVIILP